MREPKKISDVRPVYPAIAQAAKVEGMVILEAVINERGVVERLKVLRSVPLLDAAAIEAVQKWRYTPTLLNGTPVSVLMTITVQLHAARLMLLPRSRDHCHAAGARPAQEAVASIRRFARPSSASTRHRKRRTSRAISRCGARPLSGRGRSS